jgi:predicted Zn-dependent protease
MLVLSLLVGLSVHGQNADGTLAVRGTPPEPTANANLTPQDTGVSNKPKIPPKYDVDRIGDRGIGNGVNIYSVEKEQRLGRQLANEIDQESKFLDDQMVLNYINNLTQNIVRHSDRRMSFSVRVLDNEEVNAFALPGGYLYVNTGLIAAAENEAELAGVIAHEVAHVAARHGTKSETKGVIWNLATLPLVFVGGAAGAAVRQLAGIAGPMSSLRFSRKAELEADLLGIEYVYSAGYDPICLVQLFERVNAGQTRPRSRLANAFSTHPLTSTRIIAAQEVISRYLPGRDSYLVNTSEFDMIRERISSRQLQSRLGKWSNGPVLLRRVDSASQPDKSDAPPESEPHKH